MSKPRHTKNGHIITVKILGAEYASCKLSEKGRHYGLTADERDYWFVDPLCDDDGHTSPEIPPYLPIELRAISHNLPDLTEQFLEELRQEFDQLRRNSQQMSPESLCRRYGLGEPTPGNLEKTENYRERNLAFTFEQYRQGPGGYNCWLRHGSDSLANALGYIWHLPQDGTKASVGQSLVWRVAGCQKVSVEAAHKTVRRIRYVIIYDDEPKFSRVFLAGLKISDGAKASPRSVTLDELEVVLRRTVKDQCERVMTTLVAPILMNLVKTGGTIVDLGNKLASGQDKLEGSMEESKLVIGELRTAVGNVKNDAAETQKILVTIAGDAKATNSLAAEAKDAAVLAAESAVAAKYAAGESMKAVEAKLIPQYESLEAVKDTELRAAVLAVLAQTEMPTVERDIIELYYRQNLSQDNIIKELRRKGRGKGKLFVGEVIKKFNATLRSRGLRSKERVTGEELPPPHGYGEDLKPQAITLDTPATALINNDPDEVDAENMINAWRKAKPEEKKTLESYYTWLPEELRQAGEIPLTKPK